MITISPTYCLAVCSHPDRWLLFEMQQRWAVRLERSYGPNLPLVSAHSEERGNSQTQIVHSSPDVPLYRVVHQLTPASFIALRNPAYVVLP
jgi:hypothetical protein